MKIHRMAVTCVSVAMLWIGLAPAQEQPGDRINVPLPDPSRPVKLKVGLLSGSITVKGGAVKEVVVESRLRATEGESEEKPERPRGLKLIPNRSSGLTVEEDDNEVTISTGMRGGSTTVDVTVRVPANCSMNLSTVNDGNIEVENVNGDLEINNTNGHVTLSNISGSATVHALNEDIVATFLKLNPQKTMSFSSLNGKIDVTLPADAKATLAMKSDMGEIYSDFDMKLETSSTKVSDNEKGKKGKFRVTIDKSMRGTINGGGPEIQFTNFNGDIYIRKGK
jgi:DUF4097 and DUF4098 domain-containing protein YvlB